MQYWIGALTLLLLVKLHVRKLKSWFFRWSFFLLRSCFIYINQPFNLARNTIAKSGFFPQRLAWICQLQKRVCVIAGQRLKCRDRNLVSFFLYVSYVLLLKMFVWTSCIVAGLLVILKSCIILLSPFLSVTTKTANDFFLCTEKLG